MSASSFLAPSDAHCASGAGQPKRQQEPARGCEVGTRSALARKATGYAETADPRNSVFALAEPDGEPLPNLTRAALLWIGARWAEVDPRSGEIVAVGGGDA